MYVNRINNDSLTDDLQSVLRGCVSNNRIHQARLHTMYAGKMLGICMWYAQNKEEAEEILQDGFIRVYKYIHTYSGMGVFDAWIRRVMVNTALSRYRNKTSQMWIVTEYNADLHEPSEDPSFIADMDEKDLVKLVQTLPPRYRMVFNLYVFEGLKHREIAELLMISEGTSKSNLYDARKILRADLSVSINVVSS